jgi:predicted dehydrogenase
MASTLRVAMIGLGNISAVHRGILARLPAVAITAVWDPLLEHAQRIASGLGPDCRAYADYHELLTQAEVDCAFIALPPHRHHDQEILCARRGLPFLVEKPVVRQLAQGLAIEAEVNRSQVLHAVGYHYRYTPHVELARTTLAGAVIGLAMGHTCWAHQTHESQAPWHAWLFDDALGGGQLHEHATHVVDLARYLVGDIERVTAHGRRRREHDIAGYNTSDVITVQFEFASGALGQLAVSHMTPTSYWWGLNLLADRAIVEFAPRSVRLVVAGESHLHEPAAPNGLHAWQDIAFIEAVRSGRRELIRSTYSDALRSSAVTIAALASITADGAPCRPADLLVEARASMSDFTIPA